MNERTDDFDTYVKDFISEMESVDEIADSMLKIGENYICSKQIEARLLADWMHRFAQRLKEIHSKE